MAAQRQEGDCRSRRGRLRARLVLGHVEVALNGGEREVRHARGLPRQAQLMRHVSLGRAPQ